MWVLIFRIGYSSQNKACISGSVFIPSASRRLYIPSEIPPPDLPAIPPLYTAVGYFTGSRYPKKFISIGYPHRN
jgi:hypothetical protein